MQIIKTGLWEGLGARLGIYTSSAALQMSVYIYIYIYIGDLKAKGVLEQL